MGAESWTVIGAATVILVAIAASNRSLRREFNARLQRLEGDLNARLDTLDGDLRRIEVGLRERLAKLEGLFEGMRESMLDGTRR